MSRQHYQTYFDRYLLLKSYLTSSYAPYFDMDEYGQLDHESTIQAINRPTINTLKEILIVKRAKFNEPSTMETFDYSNITPDLIGKATNIINQIRPFVFNYRTKPEKFLRKGVYHCAELFIHISLSHDNIYVMCYVNGHHMYDDDGFKFIDNDPLHCDTYREIRNMLNKITSLENRIVINRCNTDQYKSYTKYLRYNNISHVAVLADIINNIFQRKPQKDQQHIDAMPVDCRRATDIDLISL